MNNRGGKLLQLKTCGVAVLLAVLLALPASASTGTVPSTGLEPGKPGETGQTSKAQTVLLPGHRLLSATVERVVGDMVRINTGEVEPRFIPVKEALEKGLPPLKRGDRLTLAVNDQNLVIDYRLADQEPWYRIVRGQLAQPLPVGHEWAVIRVEDGKEEAVAVRPLARSKVAAIPTNVPAIFLLDQANKVVDATFGSEHVLYRAAMTWKKSPPKAPYEGVKGTIVKPVNWITIKTERGEEKPYELRPFVLEKLAKVPPGEQILLLIDEEGKVADIALPRTIPARS